MSSNDLKVSSLQWRKARRSAGNGACVEVSPAGGQILIRDSKDRNGPVMEYSERSWHIFIVGAKTGRFDPDRF